MWKSLFVAFLLPVFLVLPACSVSNPTGTAQTLEQKAAAIYGQFVIAEEAARDIVCPNYLAVRAAPTTIACAPTVPKGVVNAIASADRIAKPLADVMAASSRQYAAIRAAEGTGPKVAAALNALTVAYTEALPSIKALIAAVAAQKEST